MESLLFGIQFFGMFLAFVLPFVAFIAWTGWFPYTTLVVVEEEAIPHPFGLRRVENRIVTSEVTMHGYNPHSWPVGAPCPVGEAETVLRRIS